MKLSICENTNQILVGPEQENGISDSENFIKKYRTKTIFKNLSPKWEESFIIYEILHLNKTLKFKINDEDSGKLLIKL